MIGIGATILETRIDMTEIARRPTTHGTIALFNLDAQIDSLQEDVRVGRGTVAGRAALAELVMLRGTIIGRIAEYEQAEEIVNQLVRDAASDPAAIFARARARAVFHRFAEALDDLDRAVRLSLDVETANAERAAILQALGRYDEARALREEGANRRPSFETIGALAGLCAERGEIDLAVQLHKETVRLYRGVSPFPLALLEFQLGLMWMNHDLWNAARTSFATALHRVPAYAPAQGHLAEVEAELGQTETAIARLYPLAISSDDPDYAGQLARILGNVGHADESHRWRQFAAARYDELIAAHPEAFADHAAEFWLADGSDPVKALRLARTNLEVRQTPRARDLLSQAVVAACRGVPPSSPESKRVLRAGREL
jgi:tetratricopeptide (TPR) repeat protein